MTKLKYTYERFIKHTFLTKRFFYVWGIAVFVFIVSFSFDFLFPLAKLILIFLGAFTLLDFILVQLYDKKVACTRTTPHVLPLGDEQHIGLYIKNNQNSIENFELVDELPEEFQKRDFSFKFYMAAGEEKKLYYNVRPLTRGAYKFVNTNVFVSNPLLSR